MNKLLNRLKQNALPLAILAGLAPLAHAETTVFSSNFDSGAIPSEISAGTASLTGVQGFAGLGPSGNQFAGSFLRSATGNTVTLTLNNLQAHSAISIGFLFAAIDSLDGTGTFPQGDYFRVSLDGREIFNESFANAAPYQTQSYVPPIGGELARRANLGFTEDYFSSDSAYNLALEPKFRNLAHTASTAVFTFQIEGVGIQDINDESWAMDNLRVSVTPVPEPESYALFLAGLGLLGLSARRHRPQRQA